MAEEAPATVGETVRKLRRWRGKDQETLAGLVGRSQAWLSNVESGKTRLDRRTDIEALADALQVHPLDIMGKPYRTAGKRTYEIEALIPAIRVALSDVPDAPAQPLAELARRVERASAAMWRDGDLIELAASLPGLLGGVRLAGANGGAEEDRRQALRLLAVTSSVAFPMLKHLGYADLALVCANMCTTAAQELDDPLWLAYAGFRQSHALIPVGHPERALEISRKAIDTIEPHIGAGIDNLRMYGFAHLTSAVWPAQASRRDDAVTHLQEAETISQRVADGDFWDLFFGPTNVAIHRTQVMATLGDGESLPGLAAQVDEDAIPGAVQRSYLHTNVGHGLIHAHGRADDAVQELRRAEEIAPLRFRTRAIIPPLLMALFGQPMRPSSLRELRGMAFRVGAGLN